MCTVQDLMALRNDKAETQTAWLPRGAALMQDEPGTTAELHSASLQGLSARSKDKARSCVVIGEVGTFAQCTSATDLLSRLACMILQLLHTRTSYPPHPTQSPGFCTVQIVGNHQTSFQGGPNCTVHTRCLTDHLALEAMGKTSPRV